jgi:hypothetical protein
LTWQHTEKETVDETSASELFKEIGKLTGALNKHLAEEPPCQHSIRAILNDAWGEEQE